MNFTFCAIRDPFLIQEEHFILFFTRAGFDILDFSVRKSNEFKDLQKYLEKIGYVEVDDLRFEFSGTYKSKNPSFEDIVDHLAFMQIFYNKDLEENMVKDFYIIDQIINERKINEFFDNFSEKENNDKMTKIYNPNFGFNYKMPSIGDDVDISFYLIVDFLFREKTNDFRVDLNGSFLLERNSDNNHRNLVKILTETFERFEPNDYQDFSSFETMHFRSKKSKREILDEVSFLYEVYIQLKKPKDKSFVPYKLEHNFSIFDIKDVINLEERIVISVDFFDYRNMMEISEAIKNGLSEGFEKNISIEEIKNSSKLLKETLNKKMLQAADKEEFDKATFIKKDIKKIDEKLELYQKESGQDYLDIQEFHHFFNLK